MRNPLAIYFLLLLSSLSGVDAAIANCSCVSFRLDDIQDIFTAPAQLAVMEVFRTTNTPLTIGIIANQFGGDNNLVTYVQNAVHNTNWEVEIACHGFNHEDFGIRNESEQTDLMFRANNIIQFFTGLRPKTFIPPFNSFNGSTIPAMKANNYTHWSAQLDTDPGPYSLYARANTLYNFPIGSSTADLNNEVFFAPQTAQYSWNLIRGQLATYGWASVMMHPMEFTNQISGGVYAANYAVNYTAIAQLQQLIQLVKSSGLRIVPIGRQNLDAPNVTLTGSTTPLPPATLTCNCIAFRIDGLQDFYLTLGARAIMDVFAEFGYPFTAGIIAQQYGNDLPFYGYLQNALNNVTWGVEAAANGLNGESYFTLPANQQAPTMLQAINTLQQKTGKKPVTFIPPYGDFTAATLAACQQNNISFFSSIAKRDRPPYQLSGTNLYRLSAASSTSDPNNLQYFSGLPHDQTFQLLSTQLYRDGFSVVNVNPNEFHAYNGTTYIENQVNYTQVNELRLLLQQIRSSGKRVVPVSKIISFVGVPLTTGFVTTAQATTGQATTGQATTGQATTGQVTTGRAPTSAPTSAATSAPTSAATSQAQTSQPQTSQAQSSQAQSSQAQSSQAQSSQAQSSQAQSSQAQTSAPSTVAASSNVHVNNASVTIRTYLSTIIVFICVLVL